MIWRKPSLHLNDSPVCRIHGLLPILKAEQQFHFLDESRQEPWETNNDLVNHLQSSREILTIFIVLCLGQTKQQLGIIQHRLIQNMILTLILNRNKNLHV